MSQDFLKFIVQDFLEFMVPKIFAKLILYNRLAQAEGGGGLLYDIFLQKRDCPELVMSTIPKRKYKRSDIEANYRNKTKTFWCVPKKEVERFYLVQKPGNRNNNVFMCTRTF